MPHPNATVGAGGTGLGLFVVWFLGNVWPHVAFSAEDGAVIAGGIGTVALFVGRRGVAGIVKMIWKGGAS